jgi:predicted metalloprotease with PDZ domain
MFATTQSIPKPATVNTMFCFREMPTTFDHPFDAQTVFSDLSSKYGVKRSPMHLLPMIAGDAVLGIQFEMQDGLNVGQRIRGFLDGSLAEKAGVKAGDIAVAFNGISIKDEDAIRAESLTWNVGDEVALKVRRGMKELEFQVPTIFNNRGLVFKSVRDDLGTLPPVDPKTVMVLEGVDLAFSHIPVAQYLDMENPLESVEQLKEIAKIEAAKRGANVVHLLRNRSEAQHYFGNSGNPHLGFVCGLLYAPEGTLGVTYETGPGYEKRRVIRRVISPSAAEAGLRIGDNVLALNGIDVLSEAAFLREMMKCKPATTVELTVARDGKELKIPLKTARNEVTGGAVATAEK